MDMTAHCSWCAKDFDLALTGCRASCGGQDIYWCSVDCCEHWVQAGRGAGMVVVIDGDSTREKCNEEFEASSVVSLADHDEL